MRLLFVSNYYPPHYIGGYELHCARVAEWLQMHGHDVRVLTSDYALPEKKSIDADRQAEQPQVYRELKLRYWKDIADPGYWIREWRDLHVFRRHLRTFDPDVVVLWNMRKLAAGIVMEAQKRAPRLVYHLMDEWFAEFRRGNGLPQFWARPARSFLIRKIKPLARQLYRAVFTADIADWTPLHVVYTSKALGELVHKSGELPQDAHVSYITYDPELFDAIDWDRSEDPALPVRFLWAGRLCEGKGLVTTLKALDLLYDIQPEGWSVDFCGPIDPRDEAQLLRPHLEKALWKELVRYLGPLPHSSMPAQYREHDAFLFTSEVHEGLPGTVVEAFAAGLPVIGTLTGGSKDVLHPNENCLTYPMQDEKALAAAMRRFIEEPELRDRLSQEVREYAWNYCSSDMVFPRLARFYGQGR